MAKVKGCINDTCAAKHKKLLFKEDDEFCPKCGQPLSYVCKSCHTKLLDGKEKYCVRCIAKREDLKKDVLTHATAITTGVAAVAKTAPKLIKDSQVIVNAGKQAANMGKSVVNAAKNIKK